jgi:nucleoside-diphosphate-sugar epimerase
MSETIGLFGATGGTGKCFLRLALEKGFIVQALVRNPSKIDFELLLTHKDKLTVIEGDLSDKDAITKTVKGAHYVVCMAGGPTGKPKEYPHNLMLNFFTSLTEIVKEVNPTVKVVLYQAGAFSHTPNKPLPMVANAVKVVIGQWILKLGPNIEDNSNVIRYVHDNKSTFGFPVIVTRPGGLQDKPGGKDELKADHFGGTYGYVAFYDLADWTLNKAMQDPSLYGTYPFVVPVDKDLLAAATKK